MPVTCRRGAALVDAELVPFGIRHDHEVAVFLDRAKPLPTDRCQPLHKDVDLFGAIGAVGGGGGEIEMNVVFDRLRLRNRWKNILGRTPAGSRAGSRQSNVI